MPKIRSLPPPPTKKARLMQVENLRSRVYGGEICGDIDPLIPYSLSRDLN